MRIEIRGIENLSWRERQVVALKETGLSTEQVAQRLGLAPGTVTTLFNRARRKGYNVVLIIEGDPLSVLAPEEDILDEETGEQEGG